MSKDFRIQLCKPDRTTIYNLVDVINPVYVEEYGGINTLTFDVPYYITDNTGTQIKNPAIGLIKQFYLLFYNNQYFIIDFPRKSSTDTTELLSIQGYGLAYQLGYKKIRNYQTGVVLGNELIPAKNLYETLIPVLAGTSWKVTANNIIGEKLKLKIRAVDIADSTVLETINTFCSIWDCIPKYDTINREINFVDYKEDGLYSNLMISQSRYLKNISCEKINEVTTKLHVFGVNDLSIHSVNPTGQNYLVDYTFVRNLDYMSQEMLDSLDIYDALVTTHRGDQALNYTDLSNFPITGEDNIIYIDNTTNKAYRWVTNIYVETLTENTLNYYFAMKQPLFSHILTKQNELSDLYISLVEGHLGYNNIARLIDVALGNKDTTLAASLTVTLNARQVEIDNKNAEIAMIQDMIDDIDAQIQIINNALDMEDFFTNRNEAAFINILKDLTFESTYVDSYITAQGNSIAVIEELYAEAQVQLAMLSTPRFSASLDVVDFLSAIGTEFEKVNLVLGNIIYVRHPDLEIYLPLKITRIEHNLDSFDLKINVANEKDLKKGFSNAQALIKSISNLNGTLSVNYDSWNNGSHAASVIDEYISNSIDAGTQAIVGGDGNVVINERGITITNPNDPLQVQRFTAGAWGLSTDGGAHFKLGAVDGTIYADEVVGNLIVGQQGLFDGIKIYDGEDVVCTIGSYTSTLEGPPVEKIGIQINNGALEIIGGNPVGGDGIQFDTNYNGMNLSATSGITIVSGTGNNKTKTIVNASEGFKIKATSDNWVTSEDIVYINSETGDAYFKGIVTDSSIQDTDITGSSITLTTTDTDTIVEINPTDGFKITSTDIETSAPFTALEMDPDGGMLARKLTLLGADGNSLLLNQYGYDTANLEWFKNMIWNSSFEVLDNAMPAYWVGGLSEINASIYGTKSLLLSIGASSRTDTLTGGTYNILPRYMSEVGATSVKIRLSFYRKQGNVRVRVYKDDVGTDGYFTLFKDSDIENGSTSLEFERKSNWLDSRASCYFIVNEADMDSKISIEFTNVSTTELSYIDGVQLEPDKTGMWPSIYQDGPHSVAGFNSSDSENNIWIGSQAGYDAIVTKKDNLYFIIPS